MPQTHAFAGISNPVDPKIASDFIAAIKVRIFPCNLLSPPTMLDILT
jgi:hypothetical protein